MTAIRAKKEEEQEDGSAERERLGATSMYYPESVQESGLNCLVHFIGDDYDLSGQVSGWVACFQSEETSARVSGMRLPPLCMMGVTVLLLLCEIAVSQLSKSLITMVDGFHTLFILLHMALPQTEGIVKHCISSLDSSPSSLHASSSLHPSPSAAPAEPPSRAQSDIEQPNQDPASPIKSHKRCSAAARSCSLSFTDSRIQAVGVFISSLLLVSLCVSYCLEIISFMVKPHPVQRPLLPVVVGAGSLLHKMLLFVLDWGELLDKQAESCGEDGMQPQLETNHQACAAEEPHGQGEELSVPSTVQTAAHNCLHSGALVLCNLGTPSLADPGCITEPQLLVNGEGESSAAHPNDRPCMGRAAADSQKTAEASSGSQSSPGWSCLWPLCLLSSVSVLQGLFTSLLALINSLVTLVVVPQLLHSAGACTVLVYLDPSLSLLAVITLIATSIPQVYRYGMLLLQASPPHVRVSDVGRRIASVPGVQAVHELHIWQLTESLTVASVHVHCHAALPFSRCADLMSGVTKVLQNVGVSCCTVQPEFTSSSSSSSSSSFIHREDPCSPPLPPCSLACRKACAASMCCSLLEKEEEASRCGHRPPPGGTNEEPQTLVIENTFL